MQFNFFTGLLQHLHHFSESVQIVTIVSTATAIITLFGCLVYVIVRVAEVLSTRSRNEGLVATVNKLDEVIYSLIIKYKNSASFTEEDKTYLEVMQQRLKEGEVIVEFLKKSRII